MMWSLERVLVSKIGRVLYVLEFIKDFVCETIEDTVAVVKPGCYKCYE